MTYEEAMAAMAARQPIRYKYWRGDMIFDRIAAVIFRINKKNEIELELELLDKGGRSSCHVDAGDCEALRGAQG